jgi:hypothetical protein
VVHWDKIPQMIGNNNAGQLGVLSKGHVGFHEYINDLFGLSV